MAEHTSSSQDRDASREPVLRPGRAADPLPQPRDGEAAAPVTVADDGAPGTTADAASADSPAEHEAEGHGHEGDAGQVAQASAAARQRRLRLLLRQCDRVLLMDFNLLAMNDWPDNFTLAAARRRRDLWLTGALAAAAVFLSGLTGFVPAWLAGGGFGAFVIILLLGLPAIRRVYTSRPSYLDLLLRRHRLLADARRHPAHLEGKEGLVWQCVGMAEYNPALKNPRFSGLVRLSEQRALPRSLTRREHVRLYLIFLLEAEKAYAKVQQAFFEGHQQAIDRGWEQVAAEPEPRA